MKLGHRPPAEMEPAELPEGQESFPFSRPSLSVIAHGSSRFRVPQVDSRWKRICWSDSDRLWYALDMVSSDSLEIATNKTDR